MPKLRELSVETRSAVCTLREEGYSYEQIAARFKISKSTAWAIIKKKEEIDSVANRSRSGRKRKTSVRDDKFIIVQSKRNRRLTASEIANEINRNRSNPISVSTVKRRLKDAGLTGRIAARKPFLRLANKKKRLAWAVAHKDWTLDQWKKVLWTDESKFEIFGSNRRMFVRRRTGERLLDSCIVPTVKHGGGNTMVWGCFGGESTGDLIRITDKLTKEGYKKILEEHAVPSGIRILGEGFTFQEDNDPKHSSRLCRSFLNELESNNILKRMIWPPQSPDLSPIELLWDELDRKAKAQSPTSKEDLWQKLLQCWSEITPETLEKLLKRMPRICKAVIKARGGYIRENV
ncbi:Transposable element Tc1 transposase [Anthophora quadrimaculata]